MRIASWPTIAPGAGSLAAYRQSPPCLVEQGTVAPELLAETRVGRWGAAEGGKRDVRRSALCLDKSGQVLFYAFGDDLTAPVLAQARAASPP